jgi:hypothetical protein
MFEGTDSVFILQFPQTFQYNSFKTNTYMQNSHCDHRNFDSVNLTSLYFIHLCVGIGTDIYQFMFEKLQTVYTAVSVKSFVCMGLFWFQLKGMGNFYCNFGCRLVWSRNTIRGIKVIIPNCDIFRWQYIHRQHLATPEIHLTNHSMLHFNSLTLWLHLILLYI